MKKKPKRTPLMILVFIGLLIAFTQLSTFVFAPDPEEDSWGKILLPVTGSVTGREVVVVGDTQDIMSGQFIWIAIVNPETKQCRPKKRVLRNTRFRTTIFIENLEKNYTLAIYVLNETDHQQWNVWKEKMDLLGVPSPPDSRRLDSVELSFKQFKSD